MKLTKQVALDLMAAMKNQEKVKLDAIRALKTAFILAKAETGADDLDDATELKIVQKLIKQRRDSAAEYQANNRKDLADKEAKVLFGGRLAEYKYYDMAPTIEQALRLAQSELG